MTEGFHAISPAFLSIADIRKLVEEKTKLSLSDEAIQRIESCRKYLDEKLERSEEPIYGINTGFGSLCDTEISKTDLRKLQRNLVVSHACGMGDEVPQEIVKLMLLLKIQGLSQGHSGVQLKTVQRLVDFYNADVLPVVYEQGSLGASGDLAPLAHLSLPLFGEGEVNYNGKKRKAVEVNDEMGWEPVDLMSKEGLALLNGTQFMSAYATHQIIRLQHLCAWSDFTAAASIDAFDGRLSPFDDLVHEVRPHKGQIETAAAIRAHLKDSEIANNPQKQAVQDPYCLRCTPQVHGATKDTLAYATQVLETEINAVTDNPTIFEEEDKVISAGNFHGQPLALVLDFLAIAAAENASICERRVYKLVSGQRGLPAFLVNNPGLNSGFMIVQYAAASAISQNKQLATPASVDSIDSSNGQEDHVSMGANAAVKAKKVIDNVESVLAIELMNASQGLSFRNNSTSKFLTSFVSMFRQDVPLVEDDRVLHNDIKNAESFIHNLTIEAVELF